MIKVEVLIEAQGVWDAVESTERADVDTKKDKMVRAFLFQTFLEDFLLQVAKKKTAKKRFETASKPNLLEWIVSRWCVCKYSKASLTGCD